MNKEIEFKILPIDLLEEYCKQIDTFALDNYKHLKESELSIDSFSFYTSVSAVFSLKIEGEDIELDSYIKYKRFGVDFLADYTQKIDDLYNAYQFAKVSALNNENVNKVHQILTKHILPKNRQGKTRTNNMYVTTADGKIEYVAAHPFAVQAELEKFYHDLFQLKQQQLSVQEIFFFAALLHLVFVKTHPYNDGNGRVSRLIEKWFLAEQLGEKAWLIQSEKNYYINHQVYYNNLRSLGLEYDILDYKKALPFLQMLSTCLNTDIKD